MSALDDLFSKLRTTPPEGYEYAVSGNLTTTNVSQGVAVAAILTEGYIFTPGPLRSSVAFPVQFTYFALAAGIEPPPDMNAVITATITSAPGLVGPGGTLRPAGYVLQAGLPWGNISLDIGLTADEASGVIYGSQGNEFVTLTIGVGTDLQAA